MLTPKSATQARKRDEERHSRRQPEPHSIQRPRYGTIVKTESHPTSAGLAIFVRIRFDDSVSNVTQASGNTGFILGHPVEEVALLYGDDLTGMRAKVEFNGADKNRGIAYIINDDIIMDLDQANEVAPFGTLLAPAGNI